MRGKPRLSRKLMSAVVPLIVVSVGSLAAAIVLGLERADDSPAVIAAIAVAAVLLVLAVGYAYRVVRSVTRRLEAVAQRTGEVASLRLPKLVDALSDPTGRTALPSVRPIEDDGHDEIRQLADSFTSTQRVLSDVAGQQMEIMQRGASDIFVTVARRNSSLVDRQLALLDELEADVDDPDLLNDYYQLDHLATRMRRNAESLLVLARSETRRRRSKPVAVDVVVRAGISEIEDYRRVDASRIDPVEIKGNVAADVSHALAEILDNATSFSPPESRVVVSGTLTEGGYELVVADGGIGLADDRLAELNALLSTPPVLGLKVEPTLGLSVVSLLAEKHGIDARLSANDDAGVSMNLLLPESMFEADPEQVRRPASEAVDDHVAAEQLAGSDSGPLVVANDEVDTVSEGAETTPSIEPSPESATDLPDDVVDAQIADDVTAAVLDASATPAPPKPAPAPPKPAPPTPTTLDEAFSSIMGSGDPLPTRRPGDAAPGFVDDHSRSVAAPEPTRLGLALTQLAETVSASSDAKPRLPDEHSGSASPGSTSLPSDSLALPTRRPAERSGEAEDDRPVTRATTDPEALRARLSAFSEGVGQRADTLVAEHPPTEGPES